MPKIIIVLVLLFYTPGLFSQSKIRFDEVKAKNTLSQNAVTCIHQDKLGFLWLGTFNGLHRYDGYYFKVYKTAQNLTNTSSTDRITSLHEDKYGKLWVGTYDGRIHRFNPETERFFSFPTINSNSGTFRVNNYFEAINGHICLSTNMGVYFITEEPNTDKLNIIHIVNDSIHPNVISSNQVYFVTLDSNDNYWIGTDNGLNRINKGKVEWSVPETEKFYVKKQTDTSIEFKNIAVTQDKVWFGTESQGLFCFDYKENKFINYQESYIFQNLKNTKTSVLKVEGNNLWIGTSEGSLVKYDASVKKFTAYNPKDKRIGKDINSIFIDSYNQLWIKTENFGLTRFNPNNSAFIYYEVTPRSMQNLTDMERISILEDSNKDLWITVQNVGILRYNREKDNFTTYSNNPNDPASLSSDVVECIYEDREENIWIGTTWFGNGLNRIVKLDQAFTYIQPVPAAETLLQNIVRSLMEDSKGYTWAGTKNGQIFIYDDKYNIVHIIQKDPRINYTGHNPYSIYEDSNGYIWLCTKGAGVFKSTKSLEDIFPNYNKLTFESFTNNPSNENSLNSNNIYDIIVDTNNRIWIATFGGGLNLMVKENGYYTFYKYTTESSKITSSRIRDLYIDSRGCLWLATTNGLNYINIYDSINLKDPDIKNIYANGTDSNQLSYNDILMIIEDKNKSIWITTPGGGVNKIIKSDNGSYIIRKLNEKDGLVSDYTLSIVESPNGDIWVGTDKGICRYNPVTKQLDNFDHKNGLPVTLFSERTCIVNSDHNILFGSVNGFYIIEPDKIELEKFCPNICFTGFHLFNKEVVPNQVNSPLSHAMPYTKKIILKHNQSSFAIEFATLSFKSPESNQYMCKLEGFEDEWNYLSTTNKAVYNNLLPGIYTFKVKGLIGKSLDESPEAVIHITVLKPFWKTWLAYVIYVLVCAFILSIIIKTAIRIIQLKNNLVVERRVAESKLNFFTNISHEFRTPLTLILGPLESIMKRTDIPADTFQQLSLIHRNSIRLLRLINQILDFRRIQNNKVILNFEKIEMVDFLKGIYESFKGIAIQKNIEYSFSHGKNKIEIWGDIQKLDIVFFNLLSNAFKFTPDNKRIAISISEDKESEHIEIVISDMGIGIEKEKIPFIFDRFTILHSESKQYYGSGIGLSLSYEYINLHKGDISVESSPNQGSTFTVRLLKGTDHISEKHTIRERKKYSKIHTDNALNTIPVKESPEKKQILLTNDNYSVAIIEDDVDMLNYLTNILRPYFEIYQAKDGKEGLRIITKKLPDIVISDVMMPRMDGISLTGMLKNDINTSHIPVILLTAKNEIESQVQGLKTGAEAYLPKPFTEEVLLSYIESLLKQRERIKQHLDSTIELKPDEISVTPKDKLFFEEIMKLIEQNMSEPNFNVERLAEKLNVSRTVFNKKIKTITGYPPVELIRLLRLKRALQLLSSKEFNVTEVAYMVGFSDVRYFSTCFRKQFDIRPSDFIKE